MEAVIHTPPDAPEGVHFAINRTRLPIRSRTPVNSPEVVYPDEEDAGRDADHHMHESHLKEQYGPPVKAAIRLTCLSHQGEPTTQFHPQDGHGDHQPLQRESRAGQTHEQLLLILVL
jgi:hypothetical protein